MLTVVADGDDGHPTLLDEQDELLDAAPVGAAHAVHLVHDHQLLPEPPALRPAAAAAAAKRQHLVVVVVVVMVVVVALVFTSAPKKAFAACATEEAVWGPKKRDLLSGLLFVELVLCRRAGVGHEGRWIWDTKYANTMRTDK